MRNGDGTFGKGNPGGPGRPPGKVSPLTRAISDEEACRLWRAELADADAGDADARRFILTHKQGRPAQAFPDLPAIAWAKITCTADLAHAVNAMLGAHSEGLIDCAGLDFLSEMLGRLGKLFETVELAPEIKRIKERLEEREAASA